MSFAQPPMTRMPNYDTRGHACDDEPDFAAIHKHLYASDEVYRKASDAYDALAELNLSHHQHLRAALAEAMAEWDA